MSSSCMDERNLTNYERKYFLKEILSSLRTRPGNWGPLRANRIINNEKAGIEIHALPGRQFFVYLNGFVVLTCVSADYPWTVEGKIWRHIHRMRHRQKSVLFGQMKEAIEKDKKKKLPKEITKALEIKPEPKLVIRVQNPPLD